jgi:biopolymer transport protein TolR
VQYDAVVQLMAALKEAGVENVGLMTDSVDKKK